ncbi:TRO, partial [Symbiodinium necroappetens]
VPDSLAGQEPGHPSKLQMMLESSSGLQPTSLHGRQIRYSQISLPQTTGPKRNRPLNRALELME